MFAGIDEEDLDAVARADVGLWVVGQDRAPDDLDPVFLQFAAELTRRAVRAEAALDAVPRAALEPAAIGRLNEIQVPAVVAVGAADVAEMHRIADQITAAIPHARHVPDMPGAAHLLPLERHDLVNPMLHAFLAE